MNIYRGTAPFYRKKFDPNLHLFLESGKAWNYPIRYGYINVGKVTELGKKVTSLQKEDIVFSYQPHQTESIVKVSDAIKKIRLLSKKRAPASYVYVVDDTNVLLGVINMRDMMVASGKSNLESVMQKEIFTIDSFMSSEDAAHEMSKYKFFAAPVVDAQNHLVGIISNST